MYVVTKKTPTKVISQEIWIDLFRAEVKRDYINSQCDEFTGAIIQEMIVSDMRECKSKEIEFEYELTNGHESISGIEVQMTMNEDQMLTVIIDASYKIDRYFDVEFSWEAVQYAFTNELGETSTFEPTKQVIDAIDLRIKEWIPSDFFDWYEDIEIMEANSKSFDADHQDPVTL